MADDQGSICVLVVEDTWLIAQGVQDALRRLGFDTVRLAHDVAKGREILKALPLGFAILDVNLRGELVFPLAEELRARGVPLLFLTGCDPEELPAEWADDVLLPKPLDINSLVGALERMSIVVPAPMSR